MQLIILTSFLIELLFVLLIVLMSFFSTHLTLLEHFILVKEFFEIVLNSVQIGYSVFVLIIGHSVINFQYFIYLSTHMPKWPKYKKVIFGKSIKTVTSPSPSHVGVHHCIVCCTQSITLEMVHFIITNAADTSRCEV
jgi:hypothetical protein